jgi:hypothetical protein
LNAFRRPAVPLRRADGQNREVREGAKFAKEGREGCHAAVINHELGQGCGVTLDDGPSSAGRRPARKSIEMREHKPQMDAEAACVRASRST